MTMSITDKYFRRACVSSLVLSLPIICGCADAILLHPSTHPIDGGDAERRTVKHAGRSIDTFVIRSAGANDKPSPDAYVLGFCGNAARAEPFSKHLRKQWGERPVEIWAMNYPGFGGSDGPATLKSIPGAALAVHDELAHRAGDRPIFLVGYSLGTAAALHVAAQRPVAGLVLRSPPPLQTEILLLHGWWNLWLAAVPVALQVPPELNSLSTAPQVKAPAVFLLTGRDAIVPIHYQRMVVDAYAGDKQIVFIEDADHNDRVLPHDEARLQEKLDWLWGRAMGLRTGE